MIGRIFANALARRLAMVIVAGAISLCGVSVARAQSCTFDSPCDQGTAFSGAYSHAAAFTAEQNKKGWTDWKAGDPASSGGCTGEKCYYRCFAFRPQTGTVGCTGQLDYYYLKSQTCDKRPDWNGPYPYLTGGAPANGSVTCNSGCKQAWYGTGDGYFNGKYTSTPGTCSNYDDAKCKSDFGSGYFWNAGMSSCQPEDGKCEDGSKPNSLGQCKPEPCPAGKVQNADGTCENKKNECPAGNVKAPSGECLPGDGQCAAGEAKGKDGTCKRDSNGDGKPDSEEGEDDPSKDSASGGENCNSPPSCNGNPIMCLQLRTQWRIDCNTRKDHNVTGGACSAMPVCVGKDCNAQEHAQLIQQWKAACALDKLANKSGGDDGGQPEWTKVGGMSQNPGAGERSGDAPKLGERKFSTDDLDQSGFGGGSCVGFAVGSSSGVMSGFMETLASPPPFWCNFIAVLKAVFILVGAVASVFIISKGA